MVGVLSSMTPIHFDMETSDPDDCMTLAILATHPRVDLVGVTLTPGGRDQYDLVRHVLKLLDREDVPVGSADPGRIKLSVSSFHYKWLGCPPESTGAIPLARHVLMEVVHRHPKATYLTGGPLKNYGAYAGLNFYRRWVGQGGFAGDNIVPPQHRLEKFEGLITCPTFNLNGDVHSALAILIDQRLEERILVSKNVCHGVAWNREFHEAVLGLPKRTLGLELVAQGMDAYFLKNPLGKLLHDPLAAMVAIDSSIVTLTEVELYRESGKWGSRLSKTPNCLITVGVDQGRFFQTLTEA